MSGIHDSGDKRVASKRPPTVPRPSSLHGLPATEDQAPPRRIIEPALSLHRSSWKGAVEVTACSAANCRMEAESVELLCLEVKAWNGQVNKELVVEEVMSV